MNATRTAAWAGIMVCVLLGAFRSVCADEPPTAAPSQAANHVDKLPDDVPGLLEYVKGIRGYRPATRTPPTPRKNTGKTYASVEAALEKLHRLATDEERMLPAFQEAMDLRLVFRTIYFSEGLRKGTPEQQAEVIEEIRTRLESPNPSKDVLAAARKVSGALAYGDRTEMAIRYNRDIGTILSRSTDEEFAAAGSRMLATADRIELVGKPLELTGTLFEGMSLDWEAYRGKVVLVEIWATWCGACLQEFPNVERQLKQYHDRGFEVVSINLDEARADVEKYLRDHPLPWPTVYNGGPNKNPFAARYGINAGSMAILVDRDGKVVSLEARGEELGRLLKALFEPAEERD